MISRVALAWFVAMFATPAQPVLAQNFFQSIYSYRSPAPRGAPGYGYGGYPYRNVSRYRLPYSPFGFAPSSNDDEAQSYVRGGTYRTLCVRTCDGYYFPISYATPQSGLAADADRCSASCGSDARLFYYPTNGGDVETMVDLSGLAYTSLANAFKYRKTLVQGCQCRPQPWSEAELQRHRSYGESRASLAGPSGRPETVASKLATQPSANAKGSAERGTERAIPDDAWPADADDQRIIARPPPIARQVRAGQQSRALGGSGATSAPTSRYIWPGDDGRY